MKAIRRNDPRMVVKRAKIGNLKRYEWSKLTRKGVKPVFFQTENDAKTVEAAPEKPRKPPAAKRKDGREIATPPIKPPINEVRRPPSSKSNAPSVKSAEPEDEYNYEDDFEEYEDDFEEDEEESEEKKVGRRPGTTRIQKRARIWIPGS